MTKRIEKFSVNSLGDIQKAVITELEQISGRSNTSSQVPLNQCLSLVSAAGAVTLLVQRRIHDPDFLAEYSAYYSKQYSNVDRLCSRIHFFTSPFDEDDPLKFIDQVYNEQYLGFITLRPIISVPVGASILSQSVVAPFVRASDLFPVHIAGRKFEIKGTPFLQQDNAVGACAQASIWMALRTLRKKEGDRAHDPAQITDAATRYSIIGRIKPNREGLTLSQMVEAIRAAGYSPHRFPLKHTNKPVLNSLEIYEAVRQIHPYIESEIPVILILERSQGGHAIVAIGHTWNEIPHENTVIDLKVDKKFTLEFSHAVNWVPELIIHNDNSGPYITLPSTSASDYSLAQATTALPLLPADVFMSAEEAFTVGKTVIKSFYAGIRGNGVSDQDLLISANEVVFRLLLVEKRKLRSWANAHVIAPELSTQLRLMDLPKRIWVFELHLKQNYGSHGISRANSLIGFVLIDPTGDETPNSIMMLYLNVHMPRLGFKAGFFMPWKKTGVVVQVNDPSPLYPMRS